MFEIIKTFAITCLAFCFKHWEAIISIVSLALSLGTFIYNYCAHKLKLKITLKNEPYGFQKDEDKYVLLLTTRISNKSREPLSISSVYLNFCELEKPIEAFTGSIEYKADGVKIFGKEYPNPHNSFAIPLRLESYYSKESTFVFLYYFNNKPINDGKFKAKVTFNTSRGKVHKRITILVHK